MTDLPYFDLLIDERQDGGETGQMFEHQVHWGYWEDPKAAAGTRADYIAFSAETYTSLGLGDIRPVGVLRLLAGTETLTGLILIAWSASFTYLAMSRFWRAGNGNGAG